MELMRPSTKIFQMLSLQINETRVFNYLLMNILLHSQEFIIADRFRKSAASPSSRNIRLLASAKVSTSLYHPLKVANTIQYGN